MPRLPKKWKDPKKPKRGMSGFMFYSNEIRDQVKAEMPHLPFGDIAREIAKRWGDLPPHEKEPYNKRSELDRERYEEEMKDYVPAPIPKDKIRKYRDPDKPKRGMSAFMFFSNDIRPIVKTECPGLSFGDVAREISRRWKEADPEVQTRYTRMADEDKARYQEAMKEYRPPPPIAETSTRRRMRKPDSSKRGKSAFHIFCQRLRPALKEEHPDAKITELTTILAERWRQMTETDKQPYVDLALAEKSRLDHELYHTLNHPDLVHEEFHHPGGDLAVGHYDFGDVVDGTGDGGFDPMMGHPHHHVHSDV